MTTATMDSRSSSPETPEASDVPHNVAIHSELPSWYRTLPVSNNISAIEFWDDLFQKSDDPRMLQLDDILQEHVYDDPVYPAVENPPLSAHPPPVVHEPEPAPLEPLRTSLHISARNPGLSMSALSQMHSAPIVPPPAVRTCKRDPASIPRRVVYPSRDSCYNLTILTPNIPETGTKSRVETQVRVAVDLAHASTSAGEQNQYERVGSWKWLKLPPGTSTKRRTRREGKIDPAPQDILHLTATVTCASAPHNRVVSCGSCRNREAKRVARKLAARVRPAHSDSDTPEDGCERPRHVREDTTSIIQFNCPDVLDFSAGSTVLPVRITCYCRHHREKAGFNIHFTMMDHNGRLVGTGMTPPVMITDDHKSTVKSGATQSPSTLETQVDWSALPAVTPSDSPSDSKLPSRNNKGQPKTRSKPYDMAGRNQSKFSREASVSSQSSPTNSPPAPPSTVPNTRSPTPTQLSSSPPPILNSGILTVDTNSSSTLGFSDLVSPSLNNGPVVTLFSPPNGGSPMTASQFPSPFPSDTSPVTQPPQLLTGHVPPQPMPYLFFSPNSPSRAPSLSLPKIHRLIPSSGPTRGGIEVTVLGENFHPAMQLNCVFGDVIASSTQRWSDNTLLCILPPRPSPGVVAVWFEGLDETKNPALPSLFTYTDETDRTLMELALQVVGLKMTGKIEDAKNIALRIVGSIGTEDSPSGSNSSANDIMHVASTSFRDLRSLILHPGERHNYEASILKFLSLIDLSVENHPGVPAAVALSHTSSSGQTLLHIAVFLKFTSLTEFLITRGTDLDARDRNGYTALHFAALVRSRDCARILIVAGADLEIVNALGKTAQDIAPPGFFDGITNPTTLENDHHQADLQGGEGDESSEEMESDDDSVTVVVKQRHLSHVTRRRPYRPQDDGEQTEKGSPPASRPFEISEKIQDPSTQKLDDTSHEKQTASLVTLIQRKLAQIHAPQGIIPTMPQLPLPHLPEIPAVLWPALPQIPMVFPVIVPTSGWPSFLVDRRDGQREEVPNGNVNDSRPTTAQELRATWEKWIAIAIASATLRPPADEAPPMYTPRETKETAAEEPPKDTMKLQEHIHQSPVPYDRTSSVDQEVTSTRMPDADVHEDLSVKTQPRAARKYDRMLVLFWLPILLLSLLWAFHNCIRFILHAMRTSVSFKAGVRV